MGRQHISRFRTAIVGLVIASALIMLCLAYLFYPAARARYLFTQLETLQLGSSTFEDAEALAKKIGATSYGPCSRSSCEWVVRMGNSTLPHWWRGAGETFLVSFDVKDSVVVLTNTGYGIGIETNLFSPSSIGLVQQQHWGRIRRPEPVAAGWYSTDRYRYWQFRVYMTPGASAEERRRYTAYDYGCMWKYKGCEDARQLLPVAASFPVSLP